MTILTGDAKARSDNSGYEEVMGRQGLGKMNENGEMLADFCAFDDMIIGGSVFPHRRIHKAAWVEGQKIKSREQKIKSTISA